MKRAAQLDFGISYQFRTPVTSLIGQRMPATLELAFAAASGPLRAVGHDEARALLAQLDDVDFDVPCRRETVVVSELPLLDLEAKASAG
jgi:hypothetical protein